MGGRRRTAANSAEQRRTAPNSAEQWPQFDGAGGVNIRAGVNLIGHSAKWDNPQASRHRVAAFQSTLGTVNGRTCCGQRNPAKQTGRQQRSLE
jgi:hypothetical protein